MSENVATTRQFSDSRYLWLLQLVAWLMIVISVLLVAVNIPIFYAYVLDNTSLPIDAHIMAWIRSLIRSFGELIFFTLALSILLRSREAIAIIMAMVAASLGAMYGGSYIEIIGQVTAPIVFTSTIVATLPGTLGILLLFVLPDGLFFPRIGRWLVLFIAVFEPLRVYTSVTTPLQELSYILFIPTLLIASIGVWAQMRRYAQGTSVYKQQFKWVIFGAVTYIVSIALLIIGRVLIPMEWHILVQGLDEVGGVILAASITFAVGGYRLYDIDLFINRSLVYGSTFFGLGLLFIILFTVLHSILLSFALIGQYAAILIALLVTALLMKPCIHYLQHWIDTRIYGFRFDLNQLNTYITAPSTLSEGRYMGQIIDDYHVISMLGQGGLCEVYLVKKQDDLFAFKVLLADKRYNSEARKRFSSEAMIIAEMTHPNVIGLYEHRSVDASEYLVLPYIDGQSLAQYLKEKGAMAYEGAYAILQDIVSALDYVHSKGFVHRDVKPSNIVLRKRDEQAILVDFGLAKRIDADTESESGAIGTIAYMAPEQIRDGRMVDHRTDLYALGVLSYQLLTGELPYVGSSGNMLFGHLNQPPPDPRVINPDIPQSFANAIQRAMSKDIDDRYSSARAFLEASRW